MKASDASWPQVKTQLTYRGLEDLVKWPVAKRRDRSDKIFQDVGMLDLCISDRKSGMKQ